MMASPTASYEQATPGSPRLDMERLASDYWAQKCLAFLRNGRRCTRQAGAGAQDEDHGGSILCKRGVCQHEEMWLPLCGIHARILHRDCLDREELTLALEEGIRAERQRVDDLVRMYQEATNHAADLRHAWMKILDYHEELDETVFVYFIEDPHANLIKIGSSQDVPTRAKRWLKEGCQLIGIAPGGGRFERELHARFRRQRVHHPTFKDGATEWFEPDVELRSVIDTYRIIEKPHVVG